MQQQLQNEVDEKSKLQTANLHLQSELGTLKQLQKSVQKLEHSKKKLEQDYEHYKVFQDQFEDGVICYSGCSISGMVDIQNNACWDSAYIICYWLLLEGFQAL